MTPGWPKIILRSFWCEMNGFRPNFDAMKCQLQWESVRKSTTTRFRGGHLGTLPPFPERSPGSLSCRGAASANARENYARVRVPSASPPAAGALRGRLLQPPAASAALGPQRRVALHVRCSRRCPRRDACRRHLSLMLAACWALLGLLGRSWPQGRSHGRFSSEGA